MNARTHGHYAGVQTLNGSARSFQEGSSINIVFTPDFQEIVVGLSKKRPVYKHPCGQVEGCDVPSVFHLTDAELEDATAEHCAKRELFRETGIIESQLVLHYKLKYVRDFTGSHGRLKQHHFLAILKERIELTTDIIEAEEMNPPEYWSVITALKGGEAGKKINPFHQLALCKCLQQMVEAGIGHDAHFAGFCQLLGNIYDAGINIDAHTLKIDGMIRNREI